MSENNNEIQNYLFRKEIQITYEHMLRKGLHDLTGEKEMFLGRMYYNRIAALLGLRDNEANAPEDGAVARVDWSPIPNTHDVVSGVLGDFASGKESTYMEYRKENLAEYWEDTHRGVLRPGVEAYASYLPIHYFYQRGLFALDWGVYISHPGMLKLATALRQACLDAYGPVPPVKESLFIDLAFEVLLRHELFHYKIEVFALQAEIFTGESLYTNYLQDVYAETYHDGTCLEESLANNTVWNSATSGKIRRIFRDLYEHRFDGDGWTHASIATIIAGVLFRQQPRSYRNYLLEQGPHLSAAPYSDMSPRQVAENYLCNQLLTADISPTKIAPFYAFPPANFFLRAENLVPIHIVFNTGEDVQFILVAPPKQKEWERFLRKIGYYQARSKKHQTWQHTQDGFGNLTLRYHSGGVLNAKAFWTSLETLGISQVDYQRYRATRQLPAELESRLSVG